MNSTPPIACFKTSLVLGAVCPIYCPTKSSRVTVIKCPLRIYPSLKRMSAIRVATSVFPVPGLPVNDMCKPTAELFNPSPKFFLSRCTSRSAAISLIRLFTGTRPTRSFSN